MALRSALWTVMTGAAQKAARALKRDFGEIEQLQVSQKGPSLCARGGPNYETRTAILPIAQEGM